MAVPLEAARSVVADGVVGSLLASLGTTVGALGVLVVRRLSERANAILLSAAGGIMLAATAYSLVLPAIEDAEAAGLGRLAAAAVAVTAVALGALLVGLLHGLIPHEHFGSGREGPPAERVARLWLFVLAITLHNLPEGMAVGVGFGAGTDAGSGVALALGIGIQNVPEGLAVAVALIAAGYGRRLAFLVAAASGFVEPLGGLFGATAAWLAQPLLPWILGLAGGAMLFVVSDEIVPETHRGSHALAATYALVGGFGAFLLLDALVA